MSIVIMSYQLSAPSMKKIKKEDPLHEQELYSRIEIQERALQNYAREIYENIGQILSLAKLQLLSLQADEKTSEKILDSGKLVGKAIVDLRNLTRQLSPEEVIRNGFVHAVCFELKRLTAAGLCHAVFSVTGNYFRLGEVKELVAFALLQKLIYPVLDINHPGKIRVDFRYNLDGVTINFERELGGQMLFVSIKERLLLKQRLKYIDSCIGSDRNKKNLQININR